MGFQSIRGTGNLKDHTNFALPTDRYIWGYNANDSCLNEAAHAYDACADNGTLRFFCFGVHSHDYENNDNLGLWHDRECGYPPQDSA